MASSGQSRNRTSRLTQMALFVAIILLQTFVPLLGYITIGPVSITLVQVTVIIAAITMGTWNGAIIGGVWGTIEFIRSWVAPTTPFAALLMHNPVSAILARIMVGVLAGWIYFLIAKRMKRPQTAMAVAGAVGSLTNTILVLGSTWIFFDLLNVSFGGISGGAWLPFVIGIAGTNGIPEVIASAIIVPLIATPVLAGMHRTR